MAGQFDSIQTTKTFAYLHAGARKALESAEVSLEGQFYKVMNCLILQAFTVEAFLNHLIEGPDNHGFEFRLRDRASVWEKYVAISEALGLGKKKLGQDYPFVAEILIFRNTIAHGKTESIFVSKILETNTPPLAASPDQVPDWMKFCVLENAKRGLEHVTQLVETLNEKAGLGKFPLASLGNGSASFRRIE